MGSNVETNLPPSDQSMTIEKEYTDVGRRDRYRFGAEFRTEF